MLRSLKNYIINRKLGKDVRRRFNEIASFRHNTHNVSDYVLYGGTRSRGRELGLSLKLTPDVHPDKKTKKTIQISDIRKLVHEFPEIMDVASLKAISQHVDLFLKERKPGNVTPLSTGSSTAKILKFEDREIGSYLIKIIRTKNLESLFRELINSKYLIEKRLPDDHLSLIQAAFFVGDRYVALVYKYIEGEPMSKELLQRLHPKKVKDIYLKLAKTLFMLETIDFYHNDIKPENIMIENGTSRPVLIDFGESEICDLNKYCETVKLQDVHGFGKAYEPGQRRTEKYFNTELNQKLLPNRAGEHHKSDVFKVVQLTAFLITFIEMQYTIRSIFDIEPICSSEDFVFKPLFAREKPKIEQDSHFYAFENVVRIISESDFDVSFHPETS